MARATAHTGLHRLLIALISVVVVVAVSVALLAFFSHPAQGANEADSSTVGVTNTHVIKTDIPSSVDRLTGVEMESSSNESAASNASSASGADISSIDDLAVEGADNTQAAQRSITVKDPDPVLAPVAYDDSNPTCIRKAKKFCTLDPLPTAPRLSPDVEDGTWRTGTASAYSITCNDDGQGNFGVTDTASGVHMWKHCITVAVPESERDKLGSIMVICYDGKFVIATVTDTGGFAKYGRDIDLAPGVYEAFGVYDSADWGTRTVHYKYL